MRFSEIPGNETIKQKLKQSVNTGRVSHAQLFLGKDGSASFPLAWAYAQYISCQNKVEDSCGNCSSCLKFEKMAHPDVHWVFPVTTGTVIQPTSDHFISEFRELFLKNPLTNSTTCVTLLLMKREKWLNILRIRDKDRDKAREKAKKTSKRRPRN